MTAKIRSNYPSDSSDHEAIRQRLRQLLDDPLRDLPNPQKCGEAERQWRGRHIPRPGVRR